MMPNREDEIDLQPYLVLLIRNWWLILVFTLLVTALSLVFSLQKPYVYESKAVVLITRSRTSLNIAEEFPTINDPVDFKSKIQAYLAIAESDATSQAVYAKFKDQLNEEFDSLDDFRSNVTITNIGDTIEVRFQAKDPETAANIANTWADLATQAINQAYGRGRASVEIDSQIDATHENYLKAQSNLEDFIKNNEMLVLTNQVDEANELLKGQFGERTWQVNLYNERMHIMEQIIIQAQALKSQTASDSRSDSGKAGDALAVMLAHAEAFRIQPWRAPIDGAKITEAGMQLYLQVENLTSTDPSTQDFQADIDRIIGSAEKEKALAQKAIEDLSDEVLAGKGYEIILRTAARIRDLEYRLEQETSLQTQLTQERDLALKAYTALIQKKTEMTSIANASNEVSVASQAIAPVEPMSRHVLRNALIAAVAGGFVSILLILGLNWWRSLDLHSPSTPKRVDKSAPAEK